MTRFVIYPSRVSNEEAHFLKESFIEKGHNAIIAKRNGVYRPKEGDFIIDWGYSRVPGWYAQAFGRVKAILNPPGYILNAVNKLDAWLLMSQAGVNTLDHTSSREIAGHWLDLGYKIIGRQTLTGKRAEGVILITETPVPVCMSYTKFVPSTKEFRVYVVGDQVIDVLEKRRTTGTNDSGEIKSEENGWVFCRQNVLFPKKCGSEARKAVSALGLDFGGVDVLWDVRSGRATILEVNTAPGIFGSGVGRFTDAFIQMSKEV